MYGFALGLTAAKYGHMKSEYRQQDIDDASTLSRLLGPPGGDRSEASPCARKMGIHDAFIHVQVRVFSRHRLIYEFKRGAIHEGFFGKVRIPGSVGQ